MSAAVSRLARDQWCDIEGSQIALFCWVEQVTEYSEAGAPPSRLHQCGQVFGRGLDQLYVRFDDNALLSLPPHVLRLLPDAPGGC